MDITEINFLMRIQHGQHVYALNKLLDIKKTTWKASANILF